MSVPVDLVLLRAALPDLTLRPGTFVSARVLDPRTILLSGARLAAQLPENVGEGDVLRLQVQEATADKLVLKIVEQPTPQQAAQQPLLFGLPLPGLASARVQIDPDDETGRRPGEPRRTVTLRYDSPTLGRLDVVLALDPGLLSATVFAAAGDPVELVRGGSGDLREALLEAVGRPAQVTVQGRGETVDVRA